MGSGEPRDRSTGLAIVGVVEVLLGVACAGLAALTVLLVLAATSSAHPASAGMSLRTTLPSLVTYVMLAVFLVWLGIGTIRVRRWARTLGLVVGWIWLLSGLCSVLLMAFVWSEMVEMTGHASGLPQSWVVWFMVGFFAFVGLSQVVLPALIVLFLRRADVVATCSAQGPESQWADDVPAHVFSLCLLYVLGGLSLLILPVYGFAVPFFGQLVDGAGGWLLIIAGVLLCGWLTVATARRDPRAWWVAVVASTAVGISTTLTFWRVSLAEYIATAPLSEAELEVMMVYGSIGRGPVTVVWLLTWLSLIAYLAYARRYFVHLRS